MKKSLCALAAISAFSGAVHAQSSVALYGIVDAAAEYTINAGGHNQVALIGGGLQGDRWGLRGTEDLGGGLKAVFVLENGFNVMKGSLSQGGDEFGRSAYVGLSSRYGTVTLGRQYDSVVDYTGGLEVGSQWATYFAAHPGDLDNMNNSNRTNNAVKYTSENYAGFKFGGLYSLGGVAGQYSRNQIWSLGAGYTQGPLTLGVGYLDIKDPNFSAFGNNPQSSTTGSNFGSNVVISGYASAKSQTVLAAGGAYTIGAATVGATYSNTQFKNLGGEAGTGLNPYGYQGESEKFHNVELNFKYLVSPSLLLGVAYDYTKGYGVNSVQYHQAAIGADYFLSKRTDLYVAAVYQHASGTDSTGMTAHANILGLSPSSTTNQSVAAAGIRHKF
jgi:predicted porin